MVDQSFAFSSGQLNQQIANAVVRRHKEFLGRGPTRAHAFYHHNLVVVVMRDTLTNAERSLRAGAGEHAVQQMRLHCHEAMRDDLVRAVEELVGCKVEACLGSSHIDPDLAAEVFVLEEPIRVEPETTQAMLNNRRMAADEP